MEKDKQPPEEELESESTLHHVEGGDPGIDRGTVEEARSANPEQAPNLPETPPDTDPNEPDRERRAGPSG